MATPPAARELTRRRVLRYFAIGLVVDLTVILTFATHPAWLQYFYSDRFPLITQLIFAVFFLGLGVTYVNFVRLVREEQALIRAVRNLFGAPDGRPSAEALLDGVGPSFISLRMADMAEAAAEGTSAAVDTASEEVAARAGGGPAEVSEVPTREEAAEEDEAGGGLAPLLGSLLSGLTRPAATGGITVNVNINFPGAAPGGGRSAGERRRDEEAEPEDPEGD